MSAQDWLGGAGTVVAIAVGGAGLVYGVRADRRADRLEKGQKAVEEWRQANRVAAWLIVREDENFLNIGCHAQNASDEPVWDLKVTVPRVGLGETGELLEEKEIYPLDVLGPGETTVFRLSWTPPTDRMPLPLTFRDNAGSEWQRNAEGKLRKL